MSQAVVADNIPSSKSETGAHGQPASVSLACNSSPFPRQRSNSMPSSTSSDVIEFVDGAIVSGLDAFSRYVAFVYSDALFALQ